MHKINTKKYKFNVYSAPNWKCSRNLAFIPVLKHHTRTLYIHRHCNYVTYIYSSDNNAKIHIFLCNHTSNLNLFKDAVLTGWTRIWYDILLFSVLIIYREPQISHFVSSNLKMVKIHVDGVNLRHHYVCFPLMMSICRSESFMV